MNPDELAHIANEIRQDVIRMIAAAGSGHPGGSLGMADIFAALYLAPVLKHNPKRPNDPTRDRLFLSNGHICPVWYATLAHAGYFPRRELLTLRQLGSRLQGHPHRGSLPGVEHPSGPLGQGIGQSVGCALAAQMDGSNFRVYCVTSDGEHDEGATWEAIMLAAKYKLANLTVIVDRNYIQISGNTEDVMPLDPLRAKYEAFNWNVVEIDGHDTPSFIAACERARETTDRPTAIIARTTPGKGVDFMEGKYEWHGRAPNAGEAAMALAQLRTLGGRIGSEHE
ncbi:MAG: transketolase [Candidatus Uhrbacteria bacterium]